MTEKKMIGGLEKFVNAVNTLDRVNHVSDKMLPNGGVPMQPKEVYSFPAEVWGRKFRQFGLRRATAEDEAAWLAANALAVSEPRAADVTELEDTRLDALKAMAEELGVTVKGNKAQVVLTIRAALLAKKVKDHKAEVLETIAQGAYEFDRNERFRASGEILPAWSEAADEAKAEAIACAMTLSENRDCVCSQAFADTARLLIAATKEQPEAVAAEGDETL
jgi:hypothetical protein